MSRFRASLLVCLAVVVGIALSTGCPPPGICQSNADCPDDRNFCNGLEVCSGGVCGHLGNPCAEGTTCNEETDRCDDCTEDADCDDGNVCTTDACTGGECDHFDNTAECDDGDQCTEGDVCAWGSCAGYAIDCDDNDACTIDSCDNDGGDCVNLTIECAEGETCVDGVCNRVCEDAADCDDGDPCTDDVCLDNFCSNTAVDCRDDDACTADSCDADSGDCVNWAIECAEGETCVDGVCTRVCDDAADCDDGVLCNGVETCDSDGNCGAGHDPCSSVDCGGDDPICEEGDISNICSCPRQCTGDSACRELPDCYDAGISFTVTIEVIPPTGTLVYGVEDSPPPGWSVSDISDDGDWDATNGAVKWFFLDDEERLLTYTVIPPGGATGNRCFGGEVNFDGGTNQVVAGMQCNESCP